MLEIVASTAYKPTPGQKRYVLLIAEGETPEKARKRLRIGLETLQTWGMNPSYRAWREDVLASMAKEHVGEVRQALLERARLGDTKAIELYLRAYDPEFKPADKGPSSQTWIQIVNEANENTKQA